MDSPPQGLPSQDTLSEDALAKGAAPEDVPQPMPSYQRSAWKKAFVIGLVIAVWFLIGLVFTPTYFRF